MDAQVPALLSNTQYATLRCLMDRIIPPDDTVGACDAGVCDYLTRQFSGDLRDVLATYRAGLEALEAEALASAQMSFCALPAAEQDALLRRIEAGEVVQAWPIDPAGFFTMAIDHAIEGFYSDPGNGGNRDSAAWQMIGFVPGQRGVAQQ